METNEFRNSSGTGLVLESLSLRNEMKKCQSCQASLLGDENFCGACGARCVSAENIANTDVAISAEIPPITFTSQDRDLVEALATLGYRRSDAQAVAPKVDSSLALDERLKIALQMLK